MTNNLGSVKKKVIKEAREKSGGMQSVETARRLSE